MKKSTITEFTSYRTYLRTLMIENNLSYNSTARLLGVSKGFLHGLIQGGEHTRNLTNETINKITVSFGLNTAEVLFLKLLASLENKIYNMNERRQILQFVLDKFKKSCESFEILRKVKLKKLVIENAIRREVEEIRDN